jgi:hypothetical protein
MLAALGLSLFLGSSLYAVQDAEPAKSPNGQADYSLVHCSGFISDQNLPDDVRLISGEQSNYKITFSAGDYVYINRGQDQGMRVGDRFSVFRPDKEPLEVNWFKWQAKVLKNLGGHYSDAGEVTVVNVQPQVSIARVTFSCGYMQRGDVVRPYEPRPLPAFKNTGSFDHFAPVSGKPVGMVMMGEDFMQSLGKGTRMYVNLGRNQGVKVGDYFRIFRYQGSESEAVTRVKNDQYMMFGFGSAPKRYTWKDLPREVIGEALVINVSGNSSTAFVTFSGIEVYAGDYVEIE